MEPNLVKISPGGAQSWWSSLLVELSPDGGAQFGIRVVSGWYLGGIRMVSGWYLGGIRVVSGCIRVVSGWCQPGWYHGGIRSSVVALAECLGGA